MFTGIASNSFSFENNNALGFVRIADTIRSFKEILSGAFDDYPEEAFTYCGAIEDVIDKAKRIGNEV